jgi:hypothetical protein
MSPKKTFGAESHAIQRTRCYYPTLIQNLLGILFQK